MALAYLWSKFLRMFPRYKIADYPTGNAQAIIIDHCLREESTAESLQVTRQLSKMGYNPIRGVLNWKDMRREGIEPQNLPNIESLARTERYRKIATTCRRLDVAAVLTAHHQDDQYETILMRLISGHGYRGLQGIKGANDIPECHGIYKAHKSGLLADQKDPHPFLNFNPSLREMRLLRGILKDDKRADTDYFLREWPTSHAQHFHGHVPREREPGVPYLTPLESEDGGITMYRPLLDFGKDRLIATCEANKVPWFEDPTNNDETMTMRNAVRHLVRTQRLPVALQKPAILALSARARRRVDLEEAEARRFIKRKAVIRDFDSCAGTLIAEIPSLAAKKVRQNRLYTRARAEAKKPHQRVIASLVTRALIDFVTPNEHLPTVSNLDNVVYTLFPDLDPAGPRTRPSAFLIGGVRFDSITTPNSTRWFLSRAPYQSNQPLPEYWIDWNVSNVKKLEKDPKSSGWRRIPFPRLWDGRYWVQLLSTRPDKFLVLPFEPEYAKAFRKALSPDQRSRLEAILKHYAPGKIRYTIPGIFHVATAEPGVQSESESLILLALPTLGIHLPGLKKWLDYEVSYKKVDLSLLGLRKRGHKEPLRGYRPAFSQSRRRRERRRRRRR